MTTLYHITKDAAGLLAHGADSARYGSNGGVQGGQGFYLAPGEDALAAWRGAIAGEVVTVTLPQAARIASPEDVEAVARSWGTERLMAWATTEDLLSADGTPTERLLAFVGCTSASHEASIALRTPWGLMSKLAHHLGYDGLEAGDQVIVTNLALLTPDVFRRI